MRLSDSQNISGYSLFKPLALPLGELSAQPTEREGLRFNGSETIEQA